MPFTLHYARYFAEYRKSFETLDEALRFAGAASDHGEIAPLDITENSREVYPDRDALLDAMWAAYDADDVPAPPAS